MTLPPTRRLASIAALSLGLCATGCTLPLMKPPNELVGRVDVYPVHGRHGFLFWNPALTFGPYRTVSIHRGVGYGNHSSHITGLSSSEEHDIDTQAFDFVLESPGAGNWSGHCENFRVRHTETHATGIHIGSQGAGVDQEERTLSDRAGYACLLDGPSGEHWKLKADASLAEGDVVDASEKLVVGIGLMAEPATRDLPPLKGNTLADSEGKVQAALERSSSGAVYLSQSLDPKQRAAFAAVCTALLVTGDEY